MAQSDISGKIKKDVNVKKFENIKRTTSRRKLRELQINWPKDIFYKSRWLAKVTNKLMKAGKKSVAEKIMLSTLLEVNQYSQGKSILVFHETLEQIKPMFSITLRRVGRRVYQIPFPIYTLKQYKIAVHWLANIAKNTAKQTPIAETLVNEMIGSVFLKRSESLKKKELVYEEAIKNRAYSHYRWV